ncbi:MAG: BrnT family toxin [Parvibaculum sp.]|uniref:BrnT family toxin n=1 Tax=Parvibaculum sp. TaxID=2024848 RepID=UPI002730749F|nr:BrnT family toxin [Parvibaculum sp.]MDP2149526.1 BrnT family toxin [Parvibaculum sp.]
MELEYDDEKRALTLEHRGLDFAHADKLFEGMTLTIEDDRIDYGESRYQTVGQLDGKIVMVVWTPRGEARRIISMRECNAKEREAYQQAVG